MKIIRTSLLKPSHINRCALLSFTISQSSFAGIVSLRLGQVPQRASGASNETTCLLWRNWYVSSWRSSCCSYTGSELDSFISGSLVKQSINRQSPAEAWLELWLNTGEDETFHAWLTAHCRWSCCSQTYAPRGSTRHCRVIWCSMDSAIG